MTLRLTPGVLRAAYDLLCETPPFDKWNMPDGDDMKFKVSRNGREYGTVEACGPDVSLYVSEKTVGSWATLLATIAHECIHIHQINTGQDLDHGPAFKKWAALVCKHHRDFDPKNF